MLKQNDYRLPEKVRQFGCRFRCLQAIAEWSLHRALTVQDITEAYNDFRKKPNVMNSNCECYGDEHLIIWDAFERLGSKDKGVQIGQMKGGKALDWNGNPTQFHFMILDYATSTGKHFVLADAGGKPIWDPWDHNQSPLNKLNLQRQLLYKITYAKGVLL